MAELLIMESEGGLVRADPAFAPALRELGLDGFEKAMSWEGGEVVDRNEGRSVVRVEWRGRRLFLKRFFSPPLKDALFRLAALRAPTAHAAVEWSMIRALKEAGLGAPEVAAVGEEKSLRLRRRSFIITAELEACSELRSFLRALGGAKAKPSEKIGPIESLALAVRRMHDAGITHPDLYSHHIFVNEGGGRPSISVIDLHRARLKGRISLFDAVRDLTCIHLTVERGLASWTDRLRFVRAYFGRGRLGRPGRRLASKVARRAARIGGRGKFREFGVAGGRK